MGDKNIFLIIGVIIVVIIGVIIVATMGNSESKMPGELTGREKYTQFHVDVACEGYEIDRDDPEHYEIVMDMVDAKKQEYGYNEQDVFDLGERYPLTDVEFRQEVQDLVMKTCPNAFAEYTS